MIETTEKFLRDIADRIGLGFALGACAALVYMPFAQRTLMKMMQSGR